MGRGCRVEEGQSQLLVLRQSGASIRLRNASPVLRRCLHKLGLSTFFLLVD